VGDPALFSGKVPLFPLPQGVLLPGSVLPLHIFEPRYRVMMRAALAGERLIAMALLKPGWEKDYYGGPPVHEVVGVGRILEEEALPDGTYNLLLQGLWRARIVEIVSSDPYRTARVELLEDRDSEDASLERRRKLLLAFFAQMLREVTKGGAEGPPDDLPLGRLTDLLVSILPFEIPVKQGFLEEPDAGARSERLVRLLEGADSPGLRLRRPPAPPSLN
jgi:Lon protease-like protein